MKSFCRILTPWRRLAVMSIVVLVLLLATMGLQAVPPQGARAAPLDSAATGTDQTQATSDVPGESTTGTPGPLPPPPTPLQPQGSGSLLRQ